MTNEEAIKILRHWGSSIPAFDRDCAVKMAIEALEKPEPCEDAVSREAVLEVFMENADRGVLAYTTAWRNIKDLPSVTPKQRTGKWIRLDMHAHLADHKCTACGQECYVPTCMGEPLYAFCPNCGSYNGG